MTTRAAPEYRRESAWRRSARELEKGRSGHRVGRASLERKVHLARLRRRVASAPAATDTAITELEPFHRDDFERFAGGLMSSERSHECAALDIPHGHAISFGDDVVDVESDAKRLVHLEPERRGDVQAAPA